MGRDDSFAASHRWIRQTLLLAGAAVVCGRILGVVPVMQGDNDRSRWATVRALVDQGTYAIGYRERETADGGYVDRGIVTERDWNTIDKVLHPETQEFYSSKPPLLSTLAAGEYWVLNRTLGWSITKERGHVVRTILLTLNGLTFLGYLLLLARLTEWLGVTEWGRFYVLLTACFGTFLTTFAVTFNNHTVAACSALFALYPFLHLWATLGQPRDPDQRPGLLPEGLFVVCGFFAALTACLELPAALFVLLLGLLLLWKAPWRTLTLFAPAAALPVLAFCLTNYLAVGQVRPAYMEGGGPWYRYEGSYWGSLKTSQRRGNIDLASAYETKSEYAFHMLEGHHGIVSLSPVFILAVAAVFLRIPRNIPSTDSENSHEPDADLTAARTRVRVLHMVQLLTVILTLVLLWFYVFRTNNYGGLTSGPRWFIWLTPFWLLSLLPVADLLSSYTWGRRLAYLLLVISIFSANYAVNSPWRHPWLYDFLNDQGYIPY